MLNRNPRIAWAMAYDNGLRTQACADLAEAGAKVQQSNPNPGGGHNEDYVPIYSVIRAMERDTPVLAAVGHWLCLPDTGDANQHLDDVADTVLTRYIVQTPAYSQFRQARKQRIEALVYARLLFERDNMDGSRREWEPREVCVLIRETWGVKIVSDNWRRDGWEMVWQAIGGIIDAVADEAMAPVRDATREANAALREWQDAA